MKNRIDKKSEKVHYYGVLAGMMVLLLLTGCGKKQVTILTTETESEESGTWQLEDALVAEDNTDKTAKSDRNEESFVPEKELCYVHICGAVNHPGVYAVTVQSRIYEVVTAAGGFREDACEEYLNQAACVEDGMQIRVPTMKEAEEGLSVNDSKDLYTADKEKDDGRININTASESELCTLPGIGALKASSIIMYRENIGGFHSIEEIRMVDGIKSGTFEKIKDKIKVS